MGQEMKGRSTIVTKRSVTATKKSVFISTSPKSSHKKPERKKERTFKSKSSIMDKNNEVIGIFSKVSKIFD